MGGFRARWLRCCAVLGLAACSPRDRRLPTSTAQRPVTVSAEVAVDDPVIHPRTSIGLASSVAFDGTNYLVAWADTERVRAVRVATDATVLDIGGIPLANGVYGIGAAASFDGTQFVVAWVAEVGLNDELRYARVTASGTVLDPGGVLLDTTGYGGLNYVDIASTQSGTSLIVWRRGGLVGTRITSAGTQIDPSPVFLSGNDFPVTGAVASDGSGFRVVWPAGTTDVRTRDIGATGSPGAIATIAAPTGATDVSAAFGGGTYLLTWGGPYWNPGVWGARVSTGGTFIDPSAISIDASGIDPASTFTGTDFLVIWRSGSGRHVPLTGAPADPAFTFASSAYAIGAGGNGTGQALVSWTPNPGRQLLGSRIAGTSVVDAPGAVLFVGANAQTNPAVARGVGTSFLVVWADDRSAQIYGVRVGRDGSLLGPSFPISPAGSGAKAPQVAYGNGEYLVTWVCFRHVCGARVGTDGSVIDNSLSLAYSGFSLSPGYLAYDPADAVYLLGWVQENPANPGAYIDVLTQLVASNGQPVAGTQHLVYFFYDGGQGGGPVMHGVSFDGTSFAVAWDADSYGPAAARRVATDGSLIGAGYLLSRAAGQTRSPSVAAVGARTLAAWQDSRGGSSVFGNFIADTGPVEATSFPLAPPGNGAYPALSADGPFALALWRGAGDGLFASWVGDDGSVLYQSGVPIEVASRAVAYAGASDGAGHNLVAYSRYIGDTTDANRVFVRMTTFDHGASCQNDTDCTQGRPCVDGMCCDSACGGGDPTDCLACSIAAGGSENGHCTTVRTQAACLPDGAPCDDGNACTIGDTVSGGACVPGAPVVCPAGPCYGACDPITGDCPRLPYGTPCNDGNACTTGDYCSSGVCLGSSIVTCTALDECHVAGNCYNASGCTNPTQSDGTPCSTGSCLAGVCTTPDAAAPDAAEAPDASPPDASSPDAAEPVDGSVAEDAMSTPDAAALPDAASTPDAIVRDAPADAPRANADAAVPQEPDGGCSCQVTARKGSTVGFLQIVFLLLGISRWLLRKARQSTQRNRNG